VKEINFWNIIQRVFLSFYLAPWHSEFSYTWRKLLYRIIKKVKCRVEEKYVDRHCGFLFFCVFYPFWSRMAQKGQKVDLRHVTWRQRMWNNVGSTKDESKKSSHKLTDWLSKKLVCLMTFFSHFLLPLKHIKSIWCENTNNNVVNEWMKMKGKNGCVVVVKSNGMSYLNYELGQWFRL
jgi:hypothetical protein